MQGTVFLVIAIHVKLAMAQLIINVKLACLVSAGMKTVVMRLVQKLTTKTAVIGFVSLAFLVVKHVRVQMMINALHAL